jgi:hypothetical protein
MPRALPAAWLPFLLLGCGGDFLSPRRHVAAGSADARTPAPALTSSWFSSTRIDLSWTDNVPNETGWEVWRSTAGAAGTFALLASLGANVTSYSDVGLTPGSEYCYRVRWFRKTGPGAAYGDFLNVSCTTTPKPPPAPTNVNAGFGDNSWVSVAWASPTSSVSALRVERSGSVAGPWTTLLTLTDAAATSYADFNVTIEQLYCYRVSSISITGETPSSADCTVKPNGPTNIAAVPSDAQSVDVSWTDNSQFESEYEIQRSIDGWSVQATTTVSANVTSYHDGALISNIRYYYRVRAKTTDAASPYSAWAAAIPVNGPPGVPTVDYAYPSCSTCAAAYGSVGAGTESIRVERSAAGGGWVVAGTQPAFNGWYFSESGLVTEQAVCYRAVAINSAGASSPSNERCTTPPAAPSDAYTVSLANGDAEIHWTNHSAVNDGFLVGTYYYDYSGEDCYYWGCQVEQDFLVTDRTATQTMVPGWLTPWYVCATKDGGCSDAAWISGTGAIASAATAVRLNTVTPALRTKLPKPLRDLVERGRPHVRRP